MDADVAKQFAWLTRFQYWCIAVGTFILVVQIIHGNIGYAVLGTRLLITGFGLELWDQTPWQGWERLLRVFAVGVVLASVLVRTRCFVSAFQWLK